MTALGPIATRVWLIANARLIAFSNSRRLFDQTLTKNQIDQFICLLVNSIPRLAPTWLNLVIQSLDYWIIEIHHPRYNVLVTSGWVRKDSTLNSLLINPLLPVLVGIPQLGEAIGVSNNLRLSGP